MWKHVFLGLTSLALAVYGPQAAETWPQYRGGAGDGRSADPISASWPKPGLKELWRVPTPNGFSSFAVDGDRCYTIVTRDGHEVCVAYAADTGKELWATPTGTAEYPGGGDSGTPENKGGDGARSTPSVAAGRVLVYSSELELSCLDAVSGKILWQKNVMREMKGRNVEWESAMAPVLAGDLAYLAGGGPGESMFALEMETGKLRWKTGDELITHASAVIATLHGIQQVIYHMQSGLVALDAADGKELWRFAFPYKVSTAAMPVVGGNLVFCTAGYEVGGAVCEVQFAEGKFGTREVWRRKGNRDVASLWSPPVFKDGYLYGILSFKDYGQGPLKCVDMKTGQVLWRQPGFGTGNVILVGAYLIALTDDGQLVLVDLSPNEYRELARFKALSGKCWSTPAYANGRLYIRSTREGGCFEVPR